jgi:RNA polymerase sigma factor (sigma-70 family)
VPDHDRNTVQRELRFRSLYLKHYRSVWAYAVRRLQNQADASDVVADVFTTAWRRLPEIPEPPGDLLWLYGVARRVVAGKRRGALRMRSLIARLQAEPAAAAPDACDQAADVVLDALSRLRPAEREAVTLVHWEQLSHAEAAQVLGCSENAVAIRLHRARRRLRRLLDEASVRDECLVTAVPANRPTEASGR